jgi:pSer/pThr/pTyr-binding forkhead associated (FHA) protein
MVGQETPSATPDAIVALIGDTATLGREAFLDKHPHPVLIALEWRLSAATEDSTSANRFFVDDPHVRVTLDSPVWKVRKRQRQNPATFWVGRSRHNDVILPLKDVSKVHAYFSRDGNNWFLTDLESRNGTRIGKTDLRPLSTHPIRSGHVLRIGATARFLFIEPAGLYGLLLELSKQ